MATYNKPLKTIAIKTLGGTEIEVSDAVGKPYASNALSEFARFQTMHIVVEGDTDGTLLIPFHAVDSIFVSTETEEVTKADPYGCEEGESGETESGETESGETESGETESGSPT